MPDHLTFQTELNHTFHMHNYTNITVIPLVNVTKKYDSL